MQEERWYKNAKNKESHLGQKYQQQKQASMKKVRAALLVKATENSDASENKTSIQWTPGSQNLSQQSENNFQQKVIFEKNNKKNINYG